ncbi:hypothetical protein [Acidovorax sp. SDU_ACID1]|uniref:hypothetical protein n=1 Tax=Acidovorax sp. SDU_ACID1 TaxID=3136632 RepID=UPI003872B4A2
MSDAVPAELDDLVREVRLQLSHLDEDFDKLRALVQALRLAAHSEIARNDGLYWPSLMVTLEDMVPDREPFRESIGRLLDAINR